MSSLEAADDEVCLASRNQRLSRPRRQLGVRRVLPNQSVEKSTRLFRLFVGTVREICMVGSRSHVVASLLLLYDSRRLVLASMIRDKDKSRSIRIYFLTLGIDGGGAGVIDAVDHMRG